MSLKTIDSFKDLKTGKYDWKVPARVLSFWRGSTRTGIVFKSFNMLLMDNKRFRIHAFVPTSVAPNFEDIVSVGDIFLFQNFTVKVYRNEDKFRPLKKQMQIHFTSDTTIKKLEENQINIDKFCFDFYDFQDLKSLATQTTYLADVIGVMEEHDPAGQIKNRNGIIQKQIKFTMTDGHSSVKVTFWDDFAEMFAEELKLPAECPRILIIGCGRIQLWEDEVVITNVGATTTHINCEHHSVAEIRKRLNNKEIDTNKLDKGARRCTVIYPVDVIKKFGPENIDTEVLCLVELSKFKPLKTWFTPTCTSCYMKTQKVGIEEFCGSCERIVPYPEMRFEIYCEASDETGSFHIILQDREARTILGKAASEFIDEGIDEEGIPQIFHSVEKIRCTVKISLTEINVIQKNEYYVATDILQGVFEHTPDMEEESYPHPIDDTIAEMSGTTQQTESVNTYHLASNN